MWILILIDLDADDRAKFKLVKVKIRLTSENLREFLGMAPDISRKLRFEFLSKEERELGT